MAPRRLVQLPRRPSRRPPAAGLQSRRRRRRRRARPSAARTRSGSSRSSRSSTCSRVSLTENFSPSCSVAPPDLEVEVDDAVDQGLNRLAAGARAGSRRRAAAPMPHRGGGPGRRSSSRTRWPDAHRGRGGRRPRSILPSFMTTICSATSIASSWSWVTKMVVTWTSSWRRSQVRSSWRTLAAERAEGLVQQQQHLRLDRERPGQGHALALAARELVRVAVLEALQVDERDQLLDALADLARPLDATQPVRDVVVDRHVLEGGVVLEDEADVAVLHADAGVVLTMDHDAALVGARVRRSPAAGYLTGCRRGRQGGSGRRRTLDRDVVEGDEVQSAWSRSQPRCPWFRPPSLGRCGRQGR